MVFVPMAPAPPKAGAKEFSYEYRTKLGMTKGDQCFSVVAQATQDSPKASPRKNFIEQLLLLLK